LCDEGFVSDDPDIQSVVERYASGTQTKLFVTSSKTGENVGKKVLHLINIVLFYLQNDIYYSVLYSRIV